MYWKGTMLGIWNNITLQTYFQYCMYLSGVENYIFIFSSSLLMLIWSYFLNKINLSNAYTINKMLYPYSFGIMIKEIFQATIFYTIDHYHRMDKNVVFEGRVVFGGHIPVNYSKIIQTYSNIIRSYSKIIWEFFKIIRKLWKNESR